jgi:hypothetical protein
MKAFFLALLTLFQLLPILPPASETQTPADQGASVFRLELDGLAAAELVDGQPIQVPEPAKLALESPQNHQVFQRHSATEGVVRVSGRAPEGTEKVEFRLGGEWRPAELNARDGTFKVQVKVSAPPRRRCGVPASPSQVLIRTNSLATSARSTVAACIFRGPASSAMARSGRPRSRRGWNSSWPAGYR